MANERPASFCDERNLLVASLESIRLCVTLPADRSLLDVVAVGHCMDGLPLVYVGRNWAAGA